MINICHLITGLDVGGAELTLANIVQRLDPARFSNEVVSMIEPGLVAQELQAAGIRVTSLGMPRGRVAPAGLLKLLRHLHRRPPTVLQTWLYHADLLGAIVHRLAPKMQLLWNIRCSDFVSAPGSNRLLRQMRMLARLSRQPDAVIVNSRAGRSFHEQFGYRPKHWVEIHNGVDAGRFRPRPEIRERVRASLGIDGRSAVIGIAARFHPMKDHATFLRAAALFAHDRPDTRYIICGEGCTEANTSLTSAIADAGLSERVILLGLRRDVKDVYSAVDVVTLSSAFGEGFSNVLIEAMACGVPCVATDVGDSRTIVGDSGLVVPPRDPAALARAWEIVIGAGTEAFAARARSRAVQHFGLDPIVQRYENLYEEAAGAARFNGCR